MESLSIYFMTQGDAFGFNLSPVNDETHQIFFELLLCFGTPKNNELKISSEHKATTELKSKINSFINTYSKLSPRLKAFGNKISRLKDDEYFLVLPNIPSDAKDKLNLELYIDAINKSGSIELAKPEFQERVKFMEEFAGDFLTNYDLHSPRSDRRTLIGNTKKSERICRFCKNTMKDGVTFKKVAHAIPEGLGNKNIILADECDECNEFFGNNIEPALIEHLDIYRVFLGVKGKKGSPKVKYQNGHIENNGKIAIAVTTDIEKVSDTENKIKFISSKKFTPVNLYKALCKISLSTINEKRVADFDNTIKWLKNNNKNNAPLPKVAIIVNHAGFSKEPQITNFTRKNNSSEIPYLVSEFKIGSFIYVYIVPFSSKDTKDFVNENDYQLFWNTFKMYNQIPGWKFDDLSSCETVKINETIRLMQKA